MKAIILEQGEFEIGFSSNIFLCLRALSSLRNLEYKEISVDLYPIANADAMRAFSYNLAEYCRDLCNVNSREINNKDLHDWISQAIDALEPDIVITTSQNRYLKNICSKNDLPLISTEFGPLPRLPYPENRFISLEGHLSDGPFGSPQSCLEALASSFDLAGYLERFEHDYDRSIKAHVCHRELSLIIEEIKQTGSVALLALQPEQWITWEGALGASFSPASIVLKALEKMKSDRLIVTFHPDNSVWGKITDEVFSELWLSDPRLVRLPANLVQGISEIALPYVDELVTVSSNLAMSAFLLGKKICPIGDSFVGTLASLLDLPQSLKCRQAAAYYLQEQYCVMPDVFNKPASLRHVISRRLARIGFDPTSVMPIRCDYQSRAEPHFPRGHDQLSTIHDRINKACTGCEHINSSRMFDLFGRNFLGHYLPGDIVGAELGVATGYFSDSLLRSGKFRRLYSIDSWSDHHNHEEYASVQDLLAKYGDRSVVLRSKFDDALGLIPDESLDFLYIDAYAHTGAAAEILRSWLPKLKENAFIAGHDYSEACWKKNYWGLNELFNELGVVDPVTIPGVLTANDEDIFPSFVAKLSH